MDSISLVLTLLTSWIGAPIDFDTEILPILTRSGCNAGACHGAAAGRGGFHLSLLGSDPKADHASIVEEYEGRRIHLTSPSKSLLIKKPTLHIDHEGGDVLSEAGRNRLEQWIAEGAQRQPRRKLLSLQVNPSPTLLQSVGESFPLHATASFDDGASEDVTYWTLFSTTDPSAVEIDTNGHRATIRRPGQHVLLARFLDRIVPIQVILPLIQKPQAQQRRRTDTVPKELNHWIDRAIEAKLDQLGMDPGPIADDATFLRRVSLDLVGRMPDRETVERFLSDASPDRRMALVDRLLESEEFLDFWTYRFAKLLRVVPQPNDREGARIYHEWIRQQIRDRLPMNRWVESLLIASGDSHLDGAANFYRSAADARAQAELVSQVFMGARLQCANCHNHPLDRWTQDDYHGLAAIFAKIERGQIVRVLDRGEVTHPKTGESAIPRIPGVRYLEDRGDGRIEFAKWMTSKDNPFFATSFVNRIWRGMFGMGLIEPADDVRETNPASHPELLEELAKDFIDHGFDFRHTLRRIATSDAYARETSLDPAMVPYASFYAYRIPKPLEPEVISDMIDDVTGVPEIFGAEPTGTRAIHLFDPFLPSRTLEVLGRCSRKESCEGDAVAGTLTTKLNQLNGEMINRKVSSKSGYLHRKIQMGENSREIVIDWYYRALGRPPRPEEILHWEKRLQLAEDSTRTEILEDIVWGLLSGSEFSMNR